MKGMKRKMALTLALMAGTIIGTFRGGEAKQKYISRIRDKYEDQKMQVKRSPEIILDEFEFSAFHNS
ncbi:MAG: hypothetical protein C5B52_13060 [Bacteroidetes bacterium]|nr:MAG: hypothetical protein C5B52_13060 [Bacteroidota bacterium]